MVRRHPTRRSDMRIGIEKLSQELKEKQNENLIIKFREHDIVITSIDDMIAGADLDDISKIARKYRYAFYVAWNSHKERLEVVIF